MSVTLRTPTTTAVAGVASVPLTLPTGSAAGDFALLFLSQQYQANLPSGWGAILPFTSGATWNGQVLGKYLKQADITAGSVTVTFAGTYDTVAVLITAYGTGKVSYRDANSVRGSGGSASVSGGSIVYGDTGIYFGSNNAADTCTASQGTVVWQANDGANGAGCLFTEVYNSINPAPTISFTYTISAINYQAIIYLYDATVSSDLVQTTETSTSILLGSRFGGGPATQVLLSLSTAFESPNVAGNTLVASATGFVPATSAAKLGPNVTLNYTPGGSLSGVVPAGDLVIYFGSNRATSTDTVNRGSSQRTISGTVSGCLYVESITTAQAVTPTYSFSVPGNGDYAAMVVVQGTGIALRGTNMVQDLSTASCVVNLPSGTQAGDLAVVFYGSTDFASAGPSGWATNQDFGTHNWWTGAIYSKILTSSDITTGSVTVTCSTSAGNTILGIATISGSTISIRESGAVRHDTPGASTETLGSGTTYYVRAALFDSTGRLTTPGNENSILVPSNNLLTVTAQNPSGANGWNVYVSITPGTETKQNTSTIANGATWTEPTSGLISGATIPCGVYDSNGNTWHVAVSQGFTSGSSLYGDNPVLIAYAGNCLSGANTVTALVIVENDDNFVSYDGEADLIAAEFSQMPNPTVQTGGVNKQLTGVGNLSLTLIDSTGNSITTNYGNQTGNDMGVVDLLASGNDNWITVLTGNAPGPPGNTPSLTNGVYNLVDWVISPGNTALWMWRAGPVTTLIFPSMWINT